MALLFPQLFLCPDLDIGKRSFLAQLYAIARAENEQLKKERRSGAARGLSHPSMSSRIQRQ